MPKKLRKLALNSGIQTNQILTNDDEVFLVFSKLYQKMNLVKLLKYFFFLFFSQKDVLGDWETYALSMREPFPHNVT